MDQTLEVANIEVLPSAKVWEHQRVYEKRLSAIVSKENRKPIFLPFSVCLFIPPSSQAAKVKRTRKRAGADQGEDETDGEPTNDEGGQEMEPRPRPKPRPRPLRVTRSNPNGGGGDENVVDEEEDPVTPKAKPRPRPVRRQKTPPEEPNVGDDLFLEPVPTEAGSALGEQEPEEPEPTSTPVSTRKRQREDSPEGVPNGILNSPEETEMHVRRKRIRH